MPQLTRGDITFFDAPEPVLALRRDAEGERSVLAVFNLGRDAVSLTLPQAAGAETIAEPGLPGSAAADGTVTLPAYGAWFGYVK
jgi:alpha-glucosidase